MKKPGDDSTADLGRSATEQIVDPREREGQARAPDEPARAEALDDRHTSPVGSPVDPRSTQPVAPVRSFAPDEFVAGRYRVIRFIARGGMGEVYEVEDVELRSRVALKTIRADLADDEISLNRFRREIQLARRVTHPNVCRIFDLGHHLGRRGRVTFLTMELLDGESLLRRVRARGPLKPAEALPLVQQMVAALGEAHALGIVHRDFKSDNVMLVAQPSGGLRAVVTDFGLARSAELGGSATRSGQMIGTPTYMAPEQLEGHEIGPAADQYSLGVVLYEMLTGKTPFTGETAFSIAVKRLSEPPAPPRKHNPDLDRRWERVILRCLERDPARRFARVSDVVAALLDPTHPIAVGRPRRRWLSAAALLALLAGGAMLVVRGRGAAPTGTVARTQQRSVAVLGLRNLNQRPDAAWLSTALSELLSSELGAGERLRRVPAESVSRLKRDLSLPDGESLSAETLKRVRAMLDVDYVVGGSYLSLDGDGAGGALRLDLTLQDAQTGETLSSVSQTGRQSELFDLVSRAGAQLRGRLGNPTLSVDELESARHSLPSSTEAARAYAEGLEKLRLGDALTARDLLQKSAQAEPGFALTHAALADAWQQLGHTAEQQAEAKKALDAATHLPRSEQLEVEARYRVTMREWPRAIELYRALVDFYPDSIEHALKLADVQAKASRGQDSLATLTTLRKHSRAAGEDPRVDLQEAYTLDLLGEFKREVEVGERAVEKARSLGARHLYALALVRLAYPLSMVGERARAGQMAAEASRIFEEINDPVGRANAAERRASLAWKSGDLPSALELYRQAMELYAKQGAEHLRISVLLDHAGVLSDLGRWDEAQREYEELLADSRALGNKRAEANATIALGQQLENRGKLAEAEARLKEALEMCRAIGKRNAEGVTLESLSDVLLQRGDPPAAQEYANKAIEVYTAIGDQTGVGNALGKLARAKFWMGDASASADYTKATALLDKLGEKAHLANVRREVAEVALEAGRLDEAESVARSSVAALAAAQAGVPEAWSQSILARVLCAAGKLTEARAVVDASLKSAADDADVALGAATLELALEQPAQARARLQKMLAGPGASFAVERLEGRLLLAEAELASGKTSTAHAQLTALVDEAKKSRYVIIARKAEGLLRAKAP
jgi:tetratricopeptide (TPR) repeat protein/tRNA A-37 threonylcarbamoyl transferase component Bud32